VIAMWVAHLALFSGTGLVPWIGLTVVVQNVGHIAIQFAFVRFHARLALCLRCRSDRRHGAARAVAAGEGPWRYFAQRRAGCGRGLMGAACRRGSTGPS